MNFVANQCGVDRVNETPQLSAQCHLRQILEIVNASRREMPIKSNLRDINE